MEATNEDHCMFRKLPPFERGAYCNDLGRRGARGMGLEQLVTTTGSVWGLTGCRGMGGGRRKPRMVPGCCMGELAGGGCSKDYREEVGF